MNKLTVLSFGGGQDSSCILYKIIYDPIFRATYVKGDLLVIMSDTGDEHSQTYTHVEYIKNLCDQHNIKFVFIQNHMGFHGKNWGSLMEQYNTKNTIGSKAYPKTCTDRLKLKPIYNYLERYISDHYSVRFGRKVGYKEFAEKHGKINVLIGIAAKEEKRMAFQIGEEQISPEVWKTKAIHIQYPLVEIGYDRQICQDYILSIDEPLPMPSNCKRCPHMSLQELLWLYRFEKTDFDEWVIAEQNKIDHNMHMGSSNLGVWGKFIKSEDRTFTLLDALSEAKEKYGHWTDDQLQDYKMSHGHCVTSKY